jgi:hypothetical protein
MTRGLTVTKEVHFRSAKRGRKVISEGHAVQAPVPGSVPRVSRLMALAIHMEDLVRQRAVADYSELARRPGRLRPLPKTPIRARTGQSRPPGPLCPIRKDSLIDPANRCTIICTIGPCV